MSVFTVNYRFASEILKVPRPYNIDGQFIAFWAAWSLDLSTFTDVASAFFWASAASFSSLFWSAYSSFSLLSSAFFWASAAFKSSFNFFSKAAFSSASFLAASFNCLSLSAYAFNKSS